MAVVCRYDHALAICNTDDGAALGGTLWAWGGNGRGQLGLGDAIARALPTKVELGALPASGRLKRRGALACGNAYTIVVIERAAPAAAHKAQTLLVAWGRNERDQLGLNHAAEIRLWLFGLGSAAGWHGCHVPQARAVQAALDAHGVVDWHALRRLSLATLTRRLEEQGVVERYGETARAVLAARAQLDAVYGANTRRGPGDGLHWLYSAHDHLVPAVVPQGVWIARDGKAFLSDGLDRPGAACQCAAHTGVANTALRCQAHGEPLGWTQQLAPLLVYPPSQRWTSAGDGETFAREGDMVRVGVYPQDAGLHAGEQPRMAADEKNKPLGGPACGDAYVQRQLDQLAALYDDPLAVNTVSFHYDGAVKFPYFTPGRKAVHRVQCGDHYTAVTLSNGETRFFGDVSGAMRRLTRKPRAAPRAGSVQREVARGPVPYDGVNPAAMHLDLLGVTVEQIISKQPVKEHLLVRARRGAQKPRALMRLTYAQLHRLTFPFHDTAPQ